MDINSLFKILREGCPCPTEACTCTYLICVLDTVQDTLLYKLYHQQIEIIFVAIQGDSYL